MNYGTSVVSGSGDDGTQSPARPRRTIHYLRGQEIGRSYLVATPGERREIKCVAPGAAWNNSTNLVTISKLFTNGFHHEEIQNVLYPDGTIDIYQYGPLGLKTTNVFMHGHPDGSGTNIDQGTKTISLLNLTGKLLSKTEIDAASGITIAFETNRYDGLGRLISTAYLDGTSNSVAYDCCTISSQTDREGTTTSFTYDDLKRQLTTIRNNITVSNTYDAFDNVLNVTRFGSDNSVIPLNSATYDDAGRQTSFTDALYHTTYYTNYFDGSGQLIKQTTYPDTSTRIETYAKDGSLLSVSGTAVHPMIYRYGVQSDDGVQRAYVTEVKLDGSGGTNEWVKIYSDTAGRKFKAVYAKASGAPFSIAYYNLQGQLTNSIDPDGVSMLYAYNLKGERTYSILDTSRDHVIDWSGNDRITFVTNDVVSDNGANVRRTRTYVWDTSDDASKLISTAESSVDGLKSWSTIWNGVSGVTSTNQIVYDAASGNRYITNMAPDGSYTLQTYHNGQLMSVLNKVGLTQLGLTTFTYDAHGRQHIITDARTGGTTNYFNNADQVNGVAAPLSQVTSNFFDNMGRVEKTTLADNTSVTNEFFLTGELKKTCGSRTYPAEYTYDAQGRMKTMKTWKHFPDGDTATTTWNYDPYRGFLAGKMYQSPTNGPLYTYTDAGRLATRLWARGTNTTYAYNQAGELEMTIYNDGATSGITNGYDRRGRLIRITNNPSVYSLAYNDVGELLSESYMGGPLNGISITNGYDALLRRTNNVTLAGTNVLTQTTNSFDVASRLQTISDTVSSATYSYLANSPLVSGISFANNGNTRLVTTKSYDTLNRLTSMVSTTNSVPVESFTYGYNNANQRTTVTNTDNTHWNYQYDALGQVISGKKYWSDNSVVAGQQFGYAFDDIGNRTSTQAGGSEWGTDLRSAIYSANALNQYTSRTVPSAVDVIGAATDMATVTVNDQRTYRKGEYYRRELAIDNSASSVYQGITNLAVVNEGTNPDVTNNVTGNIFLPKTPELFTYDLDGNLTNDGRWTIHWDAENRLTSMESLTNGPVGSKLKLVFAYDGVGRRLSKIVSNWNGISWDLVLNQCFVYDGWNLLAVQNSDHSLQNSFLWGLDVSGSMQGAGGIGGLLGVSGSNGEVFTTFGGNGNVSTLINATNGDAVIRYEYGPFGEPIRRTTYAGFSNPFQFATKYVDEESGLLFYGSRYYDPARGNWLGRDLIDEADDRNLYCFSGNDPNNHDDFLGFAWHIFRNGGERADAFMDSESDTFQDLAQVVGLDYSDHKDWVLPAGSEPNICKTYTVPNTVYIEFGKTKGLDGWGPIPKWQKSLQTLKTDYEKNGFRVILTNPSSPDTARNHLADPNIYGFAYAGHGGGNGGSDAVVGLLVFAPGEGANSLDGTRYTKHGINFLFAYGCSTASPNPIKIPSLHYKYMAWEKNVATVGVAKGVWGEVNGYQAWSHVITTPGTNSKK